MAFNLAQYNLSPFNTQGGRAKWIVGTGYETVFSSIGSALRIYTLAIGNERVSEQIEGAATKFYTAKGSEKVSESVTNAQQTILLYPNFSERVTGKIDIVALVMPPTNGTETVSRNIILGADVHTFADGLATVGEEVVLGANIYMAEDGFELVSESASLDIIDDKIFMLTTALQPGQTIIVDADTYTVLLDGENAIEIQSGDWIDELSRDTLSIVIGAASGAANLSARVVYTERYL